MRAREIIYYHYSDAYTRDLKKLIKRRLASGDGFEARIYSTRLNRWLRAATSDKVTRQIMSSAKDKMKQHKKERGREKFTLRDLNRLRKERQVLAREEYKELENKENMYGNKYTDK